MDSSIRKLLWLACLLLIFQSGWSAPVEEDDEYANDDNYANDEDEDGNEAYTGPPPELRSAGQDFNVAVGQDLILPCEVRFADNFVAVWSHGKTTLFADATRMTQDKRIKRFENNSIAIHHIQVNDTGSYSCKLEAPTVLEIVHKVSVVAPAKIIRRIPEESTKDIRKGEALTLACEASGSPTPTVKWTRNNNKPFLNGNHNMEGTSLTFEDVDHRYAGIYTCAVENKYGRETAQFAIHVRYAPEIEIAEETVTTHLGLEPEMTCIVHADPEAKVTWYRSGRVITSDGRLNISKKNNRHTLLIKGMVKEDFASYTCYASNPLGTAKKSIVLSGAPAKPRVQVAYQGDQQLPELRWSVQSHMPVVNFEVSYKLIDNSLTKKLLNVSEKEGDMYMGSISLSDIVKGDSEVHIRAENEYGYGHPAAFQVTTGVSESGVSRPTVLISLVAISSITKLLV